MFENSPWCEPYTLSLHPFVFSQVLLLFWLIIACNNNYLLINIIIYISFSRKMSVNNNTSASK